mmetsp:Transcript_8215/g.30332  ORF Transcript_8215/g.30332 Transcript_8215/m.30332 type:complete len:214 (-) Transcript_8215:1019-1660(-)
MLLNQLEVNRIRNFGVEIWILVARNWRIEESSIVQSAGIHERGISQFRKKSRLLMLHGRHSRSEFVQTLRVSWSESGHQLVQWIIEIPMQFVNHSISGCSQKVLHPNSLIVIHSVLGIKIPRVGKNHLQQVIKISPGANLAMVQLFLNGSKVHWEANLFLVLWIVVWIWRMHKETIGVFEAQSFKETLHDRLKAIKWYLWKVTKSGHFWYKLV